MTTASHVRTSHLPDVEFPDSTLPEFLFGRAAERGGHPAVVDGPSGRTVGYAELARQVRQVAAGLAARGLRKGNVFAILAPNSPDWLAACYGAMTAGGVVTGINPLGTPPEVATHLTSSGARFLLAAAPFLPTAQAAVELAGGGTEIIVLGSAPDGVTSFADLLGHGDTPPPVEIDPAVDLALLPYSSGTSGLPKGVMLTHRACVANVVMQLSVFPQGPDDRSLGIAPFFHATGFSCVANATLRSGGTVVAMPRFDVELFLGHIQTHRVTCMIIVPPILLALAKHPAVDRFDLSSLRWVGCGAAPVGAELQREGARRIGCLVVQGYGMTEMSAIITGWPTSVPVLHGSAGMLVPGMQARIVDVATGADLDADGTGELWLRGPSQMAGYAGNPEATAATIDADGWLHTGDIARFDENGALFIVDRLKELIKVKGFQVAPAELEKLLRTHPGIVEAAVVPMADERAGERPKAFVVRAVGADLDEAQVADWVAERVAPHKRLGAVEFIDTIPTSPSGKTLRRLLTRVG